VWTSLLYLNGIVLEDAVMDAQSLPRVVMPNHAGFTSSDPRPDVFNTVAGAADPVATPAPPPLAELTPSEAARTG
jgi:hypothetical protein